MAKTKKAIIHVNKHVIASNRVHKRNDPPLSVKISKDNHKCHEVVINGPSRFIHSPDKPLKCGAKVWVECNANDVEIIK